MTPEDSEESADEVELSAWMRRSQQGDQQAYLTLLRRVNTMLESYVRNSLHRQGRWALDSAPDIVQEILLALHSKRHTYDPGQRFLPWFYAIAHYKVIDHLRSGGRRRRDIPLDEELGLAQPGDAIGQHLDGLDARALIGSLPPKQREVIELIKIQGLSVDEASRRTGYSPSDIKVTVHRAIKSLQKKTGGAPDDLL